MRIAIAGGTGVVGRLVVAAAETAGHTTTVLSRSEGVDLTTGAGLDDALRDASAVIDVTNVSTLNGKTSAAFFTAVTQHLLDAEQRAGVAHHVALSIVGIDRVDSGYYEGKRRQEELIRAGSIPATILRATQFHEFAGQLIARMKGPSVIVPRMKTQPIAAREVAEALLRLAENEPVGMAPELAGPQVREMSELVRRVLRHRGSRRLTLRVPLPGAAGKAMADGGLLPLEPGPRGTQTFDEWLLSSPAG